MIDLRRVSKWYGQHAALRNASVHIAQGSFTLLQGPNGAGKSTMLRLLAGLEKADVGQIRIDKFDPSKAKDYFTIKNEIGIGYLGAESFLYADLAIQESLSLLASLRGVSKDSLAKTLDSLDLSNILVKSPRECSQGMLRRAAFAQAIIGSPRLILLDEPFSNLDTKSIEGVVTLLHRLREDGVTVLLATHKDSMHELVFDTTLQLENGRLEVQ